MNKLAGIQEGTDTTKITVRIRETKNKEAKKMKCKESSKMEESNRNKR